MIVAFTGLERAGKTFITVGIAEKLSNFGQKVAIIDLSKSRDLYYIYKNNIDKDTNGGTSLKVDDCISYSNIDIFTSKHDISDYIEEDQYYENFVENMKQIQYFYKTILIDVDLEQMQKIDKHFIDSVNVIVDQRYTAKSKEIQEILKYPNSRLIINQYLPCRFDIEKFMHQYITSDVQADVQDMDTQKMHYDLMNDIAFKNNYFKNKGINKFTKEIQEQFMELIKSINILDKKQINKKGLHFKALSFFTRS